VITVRMAKHKQVNITAGRDQLLNCIRTVGILPMPGIVNHDVPTRHQRDRAETIPHIHDTDVKVVWRVTGGRYGIRIDGAGGDRQHAQLSEPRHANPAIIPVSVAVSHPSIIPRIWIGKACGLRQVRIDVSPQGGIADCVSPIDQPLLQPIVETLEPGRRLGEPHSLLKGTRQRVRQAII
jgi:hypothetical protein